MSLKFQFSLFFVSILFVCATLHAQTNQLHIFDYETKQPLSGANILVLSDSSYCATNQEGIAVIQTEKLPSFLRISFIGFETLNLEMKKEEKDKSVFLNQKEFVTGDVLVEGDKIRPSMNVMELEAAKLHNSFSIGTERDPIKALSDFSQFSQPNELSGGLFVRGSSPDQSIIILDDIPLWNAFHAMGFLSVIQGDVLSSMKVYIGAQPGYSPNRLGSTIVLETLKPVSDKWKTSVGLGFLTSQVLSYGSTSSNSGLLVGIRRTYSDLILDNLYVKEATIPVMAFGDLILKGFYDTEKYGKFITTLFYSGDQFKFRNSDTTQTTEFIKIRYSYSTVGQSVKNVYSLNPSTDISSSVYYSVNDNRFEGPLAQNSSLLTNLGFKISMLNKVNKDIVSEIGFLTNSFNQSEYFSEVSQQSYNKEMRVWSKLNVNVSEQFSIEQMIKISSFSNTIIGNRVLDYSDQTVYKVKDFEPQFSGYVSANFKINKIIELESAVASNYQSEQIYSSNLISLPTDHWVLGLDDKSFGRSVEFSIGINSEWNHNFSTSIHYFTKDISQLLSPYEDFPKGYISYLREPDYGIGKTSGFEFDAAFTNDNWIINLSYRYSKTVNQFESINGGNEIFPLSYLPHELCIKTDYQVTDNLNLTGSLNYKTGQFYPYVTKMIPENQSNYNDGKLYLYNTYQYPDYFRIDFGLAYQFSLLSNTRNAGFMLQFYNITIHRNVNLIDEGRDFKASEPGDKRYPNKIGELKRRSFAYIPFFPSLGIRIEI